MLKGLDGFGICFTSSEGISKRKRGHCRQTMLREQAAETPLTTGREDEPKDVKPLVQPEFQKRKPGACGTDDFSGFSEGEDCVILQRHLGIS